jgi:pimeloyl-ACP methyl ester carboxylesterase
VAATDYAGLGTKGTEQYLIGASEAHDVLNSVRAARQIPEANAGTRVGLWGHSQGGQSVLWAASDQSYAPELTIVGTVAAAPAAELPVLISHQWSTIYGSLIGAEVLVSYPSTYGDLGTRAVSNRPGASIRALSNKCIVAAAVDIAASKAVGRSSLLTHNPLDVPAWRKTLEENTPPPPRVPTLIIQGLDDPIVLPGSNAAFLARSCAAGAPVDGAFIGKLGHMKAGAAGAPLAFTWLQQRFAGITMTSTCGTVLPIAPLVQPRP